MASTTALRTYFFFLAAAFFFAGAFFLVLLVAAFFVAIIPPCRMVLIVPTINGPYRSEPLHLVQPPTTSFERIIQASLSCCQEEKCHFGKIFLNL